MKKSEQLKEKAEMINDINPLTHYREDFYVFTESELQEYASETAREQREADKDYFMRGQFHRQEDPITLYYDDAETTFNESPLVTDKP